MKHLPSLPHTITSRILAGHADPDEKMAVIIEVLSAPYGLGPLTVPGATQYTYSYVMNRDTNCHRLIIPHSVWLADSKKIAKDLFEMPDPNVILVPDIAEWRDVYQEATGQSWPEPEEQSEEQVEEAPLSASDEVLEIARAHTEGDKEVSEVDAEAPQEQIEETALEAIEKATSLEAVEAPETTPDVDSSPADLEEADEVVAPEKIDPVTDKAALLARAKEMGIPANGTWGIPKLTAAISAFIDSDPEEGE